MRNTQSRQREEIQEYYPLQYTASYPGGILFRVFLNITFMITLIFLEILKVNVAAFTAALTPGIHTKTKLPEGPVYQ